MEWPATSPWSRIAPWQPGFGQPANNRGTALRSSLSYYSCMSVRAVAALIALAIPAFAASYRFGSVWDGERVQTNVCITTAADRIESVGACPVSAIDLSRYTAIPGIIDVHTHLTYVQENPASQAG